MLIALNYGSAVIADHLLLLAGISGGVPTSASDPKANSVFLLTGTIINGIMTTCIMRKSAIRDHYQCPPSYFHISPVHTARLSM